MEPTPLPVQPLSYEPVVDQSWRQVANIICIFLIIWSSIGACRAAIGVVVSPASLRSAGLFPPLLYAGALVGETLACLVVLIGAIACLKRRRAGWQLAVVGITVAMALAVIRQGVWVIGLYSSGLYYFALPSAFFNVADHLLVPALAVALLLHREVRRVFEPV